MGWALDVVYQTLDQPLTSASLDVEFALSSRQALPPTAAGPQGAAPLPLLIELDDLSRCVRALQLGLGDSAIVADQIEFICNELLFRIGTLREVDLWHRVAWHGGRS